MLSDTLIRLGTLRRLVPVFRTMWHGYKHETMQFAAQASQALPARNDGDALFRYFSDHKEGRGIWKFNHYFDVYERHFSKFRGQEVHVMEIGIYSGGSLDMWKSYFGPHCRVYGVDIEPRCKAYESESVKVFIGDQADRTFWKRFRQEAPTLDIVIDDGGHTPEQQTVSMEELLPHLRPGGVYLCEDVLQPFNEFAAYVCGLAQGLNSAQIASNPDDKERRISSPTTELQSAVSGVHFYPFMTVIERTSQPFSELVAPKRGSQWEPFLK